jgi:polyisoprenyl-phosphate glycosyltransferase
MFANIPSVSSLRVTILMPLRDDWTSAAELIRSLDQTLASYPCVIEVLIVDDGSVLGCDSETFQSRMIVVRTIRILRLRRNLGHQRAIAIGLAHVARTTACDAVLVMDADGEDTPSGVLQLLHTFSQCNNGRKAIFAERSRRTEGFLFRFFYRTYKVLHHIFTGVRVRVGNFSILPYSYLGTLAVMSEMWNHYAAAVFRSGLPLTMTPIPRGSRISGASRMNFVALVAHGMSAISVFGDIVGVRLLIGSMAGSFLAVLGILGVLFIRLFTHRAIPGWATQSVAGLTIIIIQFITIAMTFTFTLLSNRINLNFVPIRDYEMFVDSSQTIYPNA